MANHWAHGTPFKGLIGVGATGVVFRLDDHRVTKLPRVHKDPVATREHTEIYDIAGEMNSRTIEHEKNVLRRLGNHPGFVEWTDLSGEGIEMKYMMGGSLDNYLRSTTPRPSIAREWIFDIANAIYYAHQQHVIIGDIASRNVLLDQHLKAKLCDFGQAGLIPPSTSMALAVDNGASIETDVFQFGSLVYEIVSGERYQYDLFDNEEVARQVVSCQGDQEARPEWPHADKLPATEYLRFGTVVRKCWTRVYAEMSEVCVDLTREVIAQVE